MECLTFQEKVSEAFISAPPALAKQIYNFTIKMPRWLRDLYQVEPFPLGNGTTETQIIMRGTMPQIERDFSKWKKLDPNTGCTPCKSPNSSYNWTDFGGMGMETRLMELMERDFRSPKYAVKAIQTTAHYEQVFSQIVANLYAQLDFFKEINIGQNYLTMLAKKYVVDSSGPKPNPQNPYAYRPLGTARISSLNINIFKRFYEMMRYSPDAVPYDVIDGAPIFACEASPELFEALYRNDPQLRQDVRFSGLANALLSKYNFMNSIEGMFLPSPILFPRRFYYDSDAVDWVEVLPTINGVPLEVGDYTAINEDYLNPAVATHEEVLMHGKWPFKVRYLDTAKSIGQNTSFGPEFPFLNAWSWINTMTDLDPARREGFFMSNATIGLAPQYSKAIYAVLVERAPLSDTFSVNASGVCPESPAACNNTVPDVGCPCGAITGAFLNPVTGGTILTFAVPLSPVPDADATVNVGIDTGGYLVGTVVAAAEDGSSAEFTFPAGTDLGDCDHFTTVFCDNTLGCSATVQAQCVTGTTELTLTLSNPIKAIANNQNVLVTFNDGSTATVQLNGAANLSTLQWILDGFSPSFTPGTCAVPTVVSVCVPTATDSTCPACGGPTFTQCET